MTILGVNIRKITAEKKDSANVTKVGINNNIAITEVVERDFSLGSAKQKGLRFAFSFSCAYTPDLGSIVLEGDVLYLDEAERVQQLLKTWKEKKAVVGETMQQVLNAALNRCNIEALKISQDISLPSPIPLPKVERKAPKPAAAAK